MNKGLELANMLNGRQYRHEMTDEQRSFAKKNNLLVLYGYSDDICVLDGIYQDEVDSYGKKTSFVFDPLDMSIPVAPEGVLIRKKFKKYQVEITAHWCPEYIVDGKDLKPSWLITPDVPYSEFKIYEEKDLYCIGAVIDLNNISIETDDELMVKNLIDHIHREIKDLDSYAYATEERGAGVSEILALLEKMKKENIKEIVKRIKKDV